MTPQNKVSKNRPKDGRNAKQRRADAKRATRLASEPHLTEVATSLETKRKKQAQRWVDYNMSTGDILGYQNEIRWGLKTGNTQYMSDEAQSAVERLERERRAALDRLNREKVAMADLGAVVEREVWVDDWFGQAGTGGIAGAGDSTGAVAIVEEKGGEAMELDVKDRKGEQLEGKGEDEGEMLEDSDCMSDIEMGGTSL